MGKIYETTIRVGAEISKALRGGALGSAKALSQLSASVKDLKAAEKVASSYKKLDSAVAASKARYNQASEALRKLEAAEKAAGGATKESTKWRKAGEREVAAAARELDRATKAAERNAAALRKLGVDTQNAARAQKQLAAAASFAAARDRLFGEKKHEKTPLFQKAGEQIRGLASDALMVGSAMSAAAVGVGALVVRIGNAGDATAKMAKRVGIGVEALQELRYAGEREGASAEEVDSAIGKLAINVGKWKVAKAKSGGGGAPSIAGLGSLDIPSAGGGGGGETNPFERIGLSAKKLASLKPDEQIVKIAEAMQKLKTDSDRAAVAQQIFGREGGLKLIPMLKNGAKGIAQLRQEARDLGFVIGKDAAAQAEEFNDRMLDAKMAATGLANTFAVALLPTVTDVFKKFTKWVKDNRKQIQEWAVKGAQWIQNTAIPAIIRIGGEVFEFAKKAGALIEKVSKLVGGFGNLAIIVASVRLAPLALTIGKIAVSSIQAGAALIRFGAMATTGLAPLLAAIAPLLAVAAAAGSVYLAFVRIRDTIKELGGMKAVWQDLKDFGKPAAEARGDAVKEARAAMLAENERNLARAHALQAMRAAPGVDIHASPTINIVGGDKLSDVHAGMDKANEVAKSKVADAWHKRNAHQRRVSFGH